MATYQTVMNNTWDDPVFQGWTPDTKLVFLNLITSHRHNPIGLYAVTPTTISNETALALEQVKASLQELQQPINGYARIHYDADRSVVWIVNALKHQSAVLVSNKNIIRHIHSILHQYADCPLTAELIVYYSSRGFAWLFKGLGRGLEGAAKPPSRLGKDRLGIQTTKEKKELRPEQPHQTLVNRYLALSGTPREALTQEQVTGAYRRHARSALALISEAGGADHALNALEVAAAYFTKKGLTWTLDTVAKHLPKLEGYRHELLAQRNGLTPHQLNQLDQLATWYRAKTQPGGADARAGALAQGVSRVAVRPGVGVVDAQ